MTQELLKLLIPLEPGHAPRGAIRYALRRRAEGLDVRVALVHISPPLRGGDILWFRTRDEVAAFRTQMAHTLLEEATAPLSAEGIPSRTELLEGDPAFEAADAAERLDSDEIVLPRQYPRWISLLAGDAFAPLWHRQCDVPLVSVDEDGVPLRRKPAIVRASTIAGSTHAASRRPDHPPAPG